jgi:murein DD-endopeptidase MepM/ murein hydrolase activator NlpD
MIYVGEAQCCLEFRQISNKFAVSMIAVGGTGVGYMLCSNQVLQKQNTRGAQEGTRSHYAESPYYRARAKVGAGLYSTGKDNGVPDYIVTQMMQVFAYDVDFQRQVNADDTFEIFYGNPLTGSSTKRKVVHYTSLSVGGETKTYFRFTTSDGETGYYDANGRRADRALMRTPVPGSRISSGFDVRHTGVDFAVPYGTPLKAAGDGVISVADWQGDYGKVVRIRHRDNYETVYAPMSRIPTTIKPGVPVRQGQVIGFVGSTGQSTGGPHAHFEIRLDGRPVNPLEMKATGGRQLTGEDLAAFRQHMQKVVAMMKAAPSATWDDRYQDINPRVSISGSSAPSP